MDILLKTYEYLEPGGLLMLPLILVSCWMWALILERLLWFVALARRDISLQDALNLLQGKGYLPDKATGLRVELVRGLLQERTGSRDVDIRILHQQSLRLRPKIWSSLSVITVLAAITPLFGLLGTVTGMISSFASIASFGTGNAKAIAGGISEALITTQSGLMAAIPGLVMSVFLMRRARRLEGRLEETVSLLRRAL